MWANYENNNVCKEMVHQCKPGHGLTINKYKRFRNKGLKGKEGVQMKSLFKSYTLFLCSISVEQPVYSMVMDMDMLCLSEAELNDHNLWIEKRALLFINAERKQNI